MVAGPAACDVRQLGAVLGVRAEAALPLGEVLPEAGRAQLQPRDRLEVARDERVPDAVALRELRQDLGHVRRDVVAQVGRHAPRVLLDRRVTQGEEPVVDALRADAGERQDRARDGEVGPAGRLDAAIGRLDVVDAPDGRMDRLGVLAARLEQQRPVDVPQQQRHVRARALSRRRRSARAPGSA